MRLLVLLLLVGCATPMSDLERLEHELDRKEKYSYFKAVCVEMKGYLFSYNPYKPCTRIDCMPHRMDWDFYYLPIDPKRPPHKMDWRPRPGNTLVCARR